MNALTAKKYEWLLKGTHGRAAPADVFKDLPNKEVVVFWSGGVDSTLAVIVACLSCDVVRVVSINALTPNQSAERKIRVKLKPALERVASELQAKIDFVEQYLTLPIRPTSGWGQMPWWITSAQYAAQKGESGVVLGWLSTDDIAGVFDSAIKAMHAFDYCDVSGHSGPELLLPFRYYSKGEVMTRLRTYLNPDEIKNVTWCEAPIIIKQMVKHSAEDLTDEQIEMLTNPKPKELSTSLEEVTMKDYELVKDAITGDVLLETHHEMFIPCNSCASCRGVARVLKNDFSDDYAVDQYRDYRRATFGRSLQIEERDAYFTPRVENIIRAHINSLAARWPEESDRRIPNLAKVMVAEPLRNSPIYPKHSMGCGELIHTEHYYDISRAWSSPKSKCTYDVTDADHINAIDAILMRNEPTYDIEFKRVVDFVLSELLSVLYDVKAIKNNGTPLFLDLRAVEKWRSLVSNLLSSIFPAITTPAPVRGVEWKESGDGEQVTEVGDSEC